MHIPATDTFILIIVAVFAAFCFWKWLNWKSEAKFYTMMYKSEQDNNVNLFNLNRKLAEKTRHDGPKVLAEDPAPNKALQARNLASVVPEKTAESKWPAQDRYRLKMAREGFVRAYNDDGRSPYTPVENTAWIKGEREWIRVKRDSKRFKKAAAYFPGTDPKPTRERLVKLAVKLGPKVERMNEASRRSA